MRIAIISAGRFHICDLARELAACGHEVALYSLVPPWRTRRFGLPHQCNRWLGPYLAPAYALYRAARKVGAVSAANRFLYAAVDHVAANVVTTCDVAIGMSQMSGASMRRLSRRFGARTVLERGSRHIASQREILQSIPGRQPQYSPVPDWSVKRELAEYAIADVIAVPSKHAERSFIERGVPRRKLFRNPYGVDLTMFPATAAPPPSSPPTIIMVGKWSLRKGCDILAEAWRRVAVDGVRLLHVGELGDAPVPAERGFEHRGTVDQRELSRCYAAAHVLALASREDGFGLVQAQALASGLLVVATEYTGAEDLQELIGDARSIAVVPANDAGALARGLETQLALARPMSGMRDLLAQARDRLSWRDYGKRYDVMLRAA